MISQRSPRSGYLMALGHYLTAGHRIAYELAICFAARIHLCPARLGRDRDDYNDFVTSLRADRQRKTERKRDFGAIQSRRARQKLATRW